MLPGARWGDTGRDDGDGDGDGGQNDGGQNDGGQNDGGQNDGGQNDGGQNDGGQNDGARCGWVRVPLAVLGARELGPYLTRHPGGTAHLEHGVHTLDDLGRVHRRPDRRWCYTAPAMRAWCGCGWTGPAYPQTPIPDHDHITRHATEPDTQQATGARAVACSVLRERAWKRVNRAALAQMSGHWLTHVHHALPTLGVLIAAAHARVIDREQDNAVAHALDYGATVDQVAAAAGVTTEDARRRWGHLAAPPDAPPDDEHADEHADEPRDGEQRSGQDG